METFIHYKDGSKQLFRMNPDEAIAKARASTKTPVKAYQIGLPYQRVASFSIEKTRTALGNSLPYAEVIKRVSTKIKNVSINGLEAWGEVWVALDGGEFESEGLYRLSTTLETIEPEIIEVS